MKQAKSKFHYPELAILSVILIMLGIYVRVQSQKLANPGTALVDTAQPSSNESLMQDPESDISLDATRAKYIYQDEVISFTFPSSWRTVTDRNPGDTYLSTIDFYGDCSERLGWFGYRKTNPSDSISYKLGLPNPYGPSSQTNSSAKIDDLAVGIIVLPVGDGSGGYEPQTMVDFLSDSREYHLYFAAFRGCRQSFEATYTEDVLPIIRNLRLFQ